jgi:hypothetical protein
MLKIMQSHLNFLELGLAVALIAATTAPVSAQNVIIINRGSYGVSQPPTVGNFIYGSPIATPVPVDPTTGLMPSRTHNSYPQIRQRVIDSTLVNPVLVNPKIQDSTLVNPVIINNSSYPRYLRRGRVMTHPW